MDNLEIRPCLRSPEIEAQIPPARRALIRIGYHAPRRSDLTGGCSRDGGSVVDDGGVWEKGLEGEQDAGTGGGVGCVAEVADGVGGWGAGGCLGVCLAGGEGGGEGEEEEEGEGEEGCAVHGGDLLWWEFPGLRERVTRVDDGRMLRMELVRWECRN